MLNRLEKGALGRCFRCGYLWRPRSSRPRLCPRCKSSFWRVPVLRKLPHGTGLGIEQLLTPKRAEILRLAANHHVVKLRVFGSVARASAGKRSDVDLLVEFDSDATALDQVGLMQDLEVLLRRKVEVTTPEGLHWLVRPQALFEAVLL